MPLKAFQQDQLKFITTGTEVPTSGHKISRVEFLDTDGTVKKGFFKPVDNSLYPALLAKYSVASSVALRMSLGDFFAEERLVYEKGQIVGTVSFALDNYKPLLRYRQTEPEDPFERELVNPSKETLLDKKVAKQIAAWLSIGDEDRHPDNFSLLGGIDYDMCHYRYTSIIRGPRAIDGIIKDPEDVRMTCAKISDLPIVEGRTHWPANRYPENFWLPKKYLSTTAFRDLAGSEEFKEQMFEALTHQLLTYDPDALRSRLEEYLGDEPLDYRSLSQEKILGLEKANPVLFNAETDRKSMVDHMLAVSQEEYDELFRAVVYYPGCPSNRRGIRVPSFNEYLAKKPKVVERVKQWTSAENQKVDVAVETHNKLMPEIQRRKLSLQEELEAHKKHVPEVPDKKGSALEESLEKLKKMEASCAAYCMSDAGRYDNEKISKRFHKVWRDSFLPYINQILQSLDGLERSILQGLNSHSLPSIESKPVPLDQTKATESWQLLSKGDDLSTIQVQCSENNSQLLALKQIRQFREKIFKCSDSYFKTELADLTQSRNDIFLEGIQRAINEDENLIRESLGQGYQKEFTDIIDQIDSYKVKMYWARYASGRGDQPLYDAKAGQPDEEKNSHMDPQVIEGCFKQLFAWADEQENGPKKNGDSPLTQFIAEVIERCYTPSPFNYLANRCRGESVLCFIKNSSLKGSEKLAWIFSAGGHEKNSLNTLLVIHLINTMLVHYKDQVGCNLSSVRHAINTKTFNSAAYTKLIMEHSSQSPAFSHSRSVSAVSNFHQAMYRWVDSFKTDQEFKLFIDKSVRKYMEPTLLNYFWKTKNRDEEVPKYFDPKFGYSRSNILALILTKGETKETSLNSILIKDILADIQNKWAVHEAKVNKQQVSAHEKAGKGEGSDTQSISELEQDAKEMETFAYYHSVCQMKPEDITSKFLEDLRIQSKDKTAVRRAASEMVCS